MVFLVRFFFYSQNVVVSEKNPAFKLVSLRLLRLCKWCEGVRPYTGLAIK